MKWQGRQGSDNVEDRRGMTPGRMAIGGGIGNNSDCNYCSPAGRRSLPAS